MHSKVVILGSGPAGCTAAVYAARAMLEPTLIAGIQPGGQLTITTEVENYPGFAEAIQGPWLMEQMQAQAAASGHEVRSGHDRIRRSVAAAFHAGYAIPAETHTADTLIIATGASANWLGLPSESKFQGFGVSACATCDGFFFRGKNVAVVGGGNTAAEEALFLTNFADRVTLIHRRDTLRADKTNQTRLMANKKIDCLYDTEVVEVLGTDEPRGVTGIRLRNTITGTERKLEVDGLFIAIGHSPATDAVQWPDRDGRGRLHQDGAGLDAHQRRRRVRGGRRQGQDIPPGRNRRGHGLHGGAGGREVSRGGHGQHVK